MGQAQHTRGRGDGNDLLLLDSDVAFASALSGMLQSEGFRVSSTAHLASAQEWIGRMCPSYAVLDLEVAGCGFSIVKQLKHANDKVRIVITTRYASIASAVEAIKLGATDYLPKPADPKMVVAALTQDDGWNIGSVASPALSVGCLEWEHITRVLLEYQGNISTAARVLGIHRRTLQRKLQKRRQPH